MDVIVQVVVGLFALSALVLAVMYWKGGRWLKIAAVGLACVWVYQAQWYGRAFINARWVDDARSLYQQDKVLEAIRAGRTTIPLTETTNFRWTAVCYLFAEQKYATPHGDIPTQRSKILREVLGTDDIPYFEDNSWSWREYFVLVYATPEGPYVMEPSWGAFSRQFQERYNGRYYKEKLHGKGYWIEEKMNENKDSPWSGICYKPEDIWLEISPEPAWADNIPAYVEQIRKQAKNP